MSVVIEPAGVGERLSKRIFSAVTERRVPQVVRKRERFGQILIQAQGPGNRPCNLSDFEAVGQPDPEMVAVGRDENLGLVAQPAECHRVDDPVAVALENIARAAGACVGFPMGPAARSLWVRGEGLVKLHSVLSFLTG